MTALLYLLVFSFYLSFSFVVCFAVQENGYRYSFAYYKRYGAGEGYTALVCFLVSLSLAYILHTSVWWGIGGVFAVGCYVLFRTFASRKKKRKLTPRLLRTALLSCVLNVGIACFCYYLGLRISIHKIVTALLFSFPVLAVYPCALLSICILSPLERKIGNNYIAKAQKKLSVNSHAVRIAVTGSFGKTTVKNFLASFLRKTGSVFVTPNSYNTPQGIARAINERYAGEDFVIMEFGARRKGDIRELCQRYAPKVGVITGVCEQHLSTFKTLTAVMQTKGELYEEITKAHGDTFFSSDDKRACELYEKCVGKKYYCGIARSDAPLAVEWINTDALGNTVRLTCGNLSETIALAVYGKHMVRDFALAACVASTLGVSLTDILLVAKDLRSPPHRMEVTRLPHCTVIDDSYNANEVGAEEALNVLSRFSGRKVVVTPGLVEMGKRTESANCRLGEKIGEVCDFALISARENAHAIEIGMKTAGFTQENYRVIGNGDSLANAVKEITKNGDTVLFLNDLPDGYK
ncbi:MAG: UDP-N-acetylmuramoyl-tripeptide--D-alanyl-D-alanine ligase [Clostridiales bacterium]|nr:UDP-N-acetylmuramoyl-tripeptide--D-alanyl-D-alanine ligase [Clostridiales bacterium]